MAGEHILIVDDEPAIQSTLRGVLEDEGYRVSAVGTGDDAVALLADETPDLVFLDIWMPGRDGLETLAEMKRLRQGAGGAGDPRHVEPPRARLRGSELRGHSRGADRVGALRPREGRLHGRARPAAWPLRARRPRHALPRRDRRHEREDPGQGAPGARGTGLRAGRRPRDHQGRRGGD